MLGQQIEVDLHKYINKQKEALNEHKSGNNYAELTNHSREKLSKQGSRCWDQCSLVTTTSYPNLVQIEILFPIECSLVVEATKYVNRIIRYMICQFIAENMLLVG